ncbi:hypothetical protein [Reichenbachiella faecimaris]|nr:hypothetical protein [Reichenbachiella faecimaris]
MEQVKKGAPHSTGADPILTPFEPVNESGIYTVNCPNGHTSTTIIHNINFEILFEYGINGLADEYFREAVSSFTSATERYYEFCIKVLLRSSGLEFNKIARVWKLISNQSERQLGGYVILFSQAFKEEPILLTNKEVSFRNSVIHKGYFPNKNEAIEFGNSSMQIIETSLIKLKEKFPTQVEETFDFFGYKRKAEELLDKKEKETGEEQNFACVNIMTALDVMHGREININDGRNGDMKMQIERVLRRRLPRKLTLLKDLPELD